MDIAPGSASAGPSATAATSDLEPTAASSVQVTSHNQYHSPRILPSSLDPNPLAQFQTWFREALEPPAGIPQVAEPEAMCISTATARGVPSSRFVLLKEADATGFVFYTNYTSRKSRELLENPYASIALYWREVSRQVRAVGRVEQLTRAESERYFGSRPRGSRIGAWASEQSKVVGEDELQRRVDEMQSKFEGQVPCPEHWGGWRIVPFEVEFWAGQPSRLHDRFKYTRPEGSTEGWEVERLAP